MFIRYILFLLAVSTTTTAQQKDVLRIGLTGSATLNMHRGQLTTADGLLECGTFQDATTLGWMAGNALWLPITDHFVFDARIQYWKADGTFTSPNDVQPNVALPDGSLVRMQSEYTLETTLDYINLDLLGLWYVTPNLFVGIGPQLGVNTRANFAQSEHILEPSYLEFTQGGRERTFLASSFEQNGTTAGIRIAASVLAGYDIRVHPNIVVTPEIGYTHAFTNVLNTSDWQVHAARAGVTVSWAMLPAEIVEPPPPPPTEPSPVVQAPPPTRSMKLDVKSVLTDGSVVPGADILITETRNSDVVPLLPFVFFDAGSSVIPDRYHPFRSDFSEAELRDSILGVYHELLNIVGSRMRTYPTAKLMVGGYREPADGEADEALAMSRADVVKTYLVERWGIDANRISTSAGTLPSIVSNRAITDGRTENRRAELTSTDARILAPVTLNLVERQSEPRTVTMQPSFATPDEVTSTIAQLTLASRPLAGPLTSSGQTIEWYVDPEAVSRCLGGQSVASGTIEARATYADGTESATGALLSARRIIRSSRFSNEIVNDSIVERFRLIFFDFDKPTVSEFNTAMIDLIRSRIRTTSAMRVTGLTDRIGSVEHNTALSQRRAETILATIQQRIVPERSSAIGAGPMLIYNNNLPEGRWYNRTVLIEVATPVEGM